jgi:basic membrane lipoprotein Med (substrate-binding protein (PBP1-ABC) superfamily)
MAKHLKVLFALTVLLTLVLTACAPAPAPAPAEAPVEPVKKLKVAVAFPGEVSDQSWNQFGYEGLKKAETECNVEVAYTEGVTQDKQLETFRNYASEGTDIIIGHGGEYADAINTTAKEFPNLFFGLTNGKVDGPNVSSMIIGYNQMSYLAGALACNVTKTNHIGFVGGESIPVVDEGANSYKQGAQTCGKEVQVDVVYTGNWADVTKARESGLALIADGADVLYHILDTADAGLIAAAEDKGVYAIGLYRDSSALGPKAVVGSALGFPGTLIYQLACQKVAKGTNNWLDVHTPDGVNIHMTDLVSADVQAKVKAIYEEMLADKTLIKNYGQ